MATGYTKTLVLKTDGEDITLEGGSAYAVARQLDDNGDLIKITDPEDSDTVNYYKVRGANCGVCLIATLTSGTKEVEAPECEDPLGCPESDGEDVDGSDDSNNSDDTPGQEG